MRNATGTLLVLLSTVFGLGCVGDEEFVILQEDVTVLENRLQKMESGMMRQTQNELSTVAQSQRMQTGTLEQLLTRTSNMERDLAALKRQQESSFERLDRLEVSQLEDKQAFKKDLAELSKGSKDTLTSSLNKMRQEFNQAQTELNEAWGKRMAEYSKSIEARIKKLDDEITTFYKELEKTIQSYSAGTYIVKPGDSLSRIAQELGVSVEELSELNNIQDPSKIRAGQELLIP